MRNNLLLIDASNANYKMKEDLIDVRFKNEETFQVSFCKLVRQSQYIRDNYKYADLVESIQSEIENIECTTSISEGSIREFLQLIQEEKVTIELEHYRDIYALCEHFITPNLTRVLDEICESKLCIDVDFSIEVLRESSTANGTMETGLARKVEGFLSGRLSEYLAHAKFGDLPVSVVYRIVAQRGEGGIDHDQLPSLLSVLSLLHF